MKRMMLFVFLYVLLSPAEAIEGMQWKKMNKGEKIFYLAGLRDNFFTAYLEGVSAACREKCYPKDSCFKKGVQQGVKKAKDINEVDLELLTQMLDSLYENPFNNKIEVPEMSELALKKGKGIDIEKSLIKAREQATFLEENL